MADRPSRPLLGILLMVAAGLAFTALDGSAKFLVRDHPLVEVVWARYVFSLVTVGAFLPRYGLVGLVSTGNLRLQVGRGSLLLLTTLLMFVALRFMPIADTYAISFVAPLLVAAVSVPLLGETIARGQWLAILAGFVGVLVVVRPGLGAFSWAAGLPLLMAVGNGACIYVHDHTLFVALRFLVGLGAGSIVSLSFTTVGLTRHPDRNFGYLIMWVLVYGALVLSLYLPLACVDSAHGAFDRSAVLQLPAQAQRQHLAVRRRAPEG